MKKTIGKNTIGDGKKMQVAMRDYGRSTHNLSYVWRNTQAPGTLVPFMKILATPGDTFDIDMESHILTHPTVGPLFGSYKFQADVFVCPVRLYNALLHNNALNIGLNMNKVKFPKFNIKLNNQNGTKPWSSSSLLSYLGFKSKGRETSTVTSNHKFNATPVIAYYDIFKNYYANKQEENFYTIGVGEVYQLPNPNNDKSDAHIQYQKANTAQWLPSTINFIDNYAASSGSLAYRLRVSKARFPDTSKISIDIKCGAIEQKTLSIAEFTGGKAVAADATSWYLPWGHIVDDRNWQILDVVTGDRITLKSYKLTDIDDTRDEILAGGEKEMEIVFGKQQGTLTKDYLKNLIGYGAEFNSVSKQYGLVLKTFQSDIFNNWISTDWIDGENGINAITAVDVSEGKLELDTLILAKKVYNMLNRIAVSGGTYNDWVETVYTTSYISRSEIPEYQGGMSSEIQFQEVISNSATTEEPLGTLAGRGVQMGKKGGKITVKITEPAYVIGLCSITPRVDYSQGNDFDIMLDNLDQIHKPELDAIGFQDLQTWKLDADSLIWEAGVVKEYSVGKQPAWIDYMTNYNRTCGNFAVGESEEFMVLNKAFTTTIKEGNVPNLNASTYIDPQAYNYVFADTNLEAMNFWVQMGIDIKARRKGSAKMMPTL